jgi:hypothetical protein
MVALPALESVDTTTEPSSPPSASASISSSCGEDGSLWLAFAAAARTEQVAVDTAIARDYHPQLSTPSLIAEVRRLLFTERRAGRLVCRYLADLADRIHERQDAELTAYVDEFHATACFFDLGARETRERVRIGRALRSLPQIEAAFIAGGLSYSRVREVTRVARPETESEWLERARSLDMRSLERRVAGAVEGGALDEPQEGGASLSPSNALGAPGTRPSTALRDGDPTTDGGTTTVRPAALTHAPTERIDRDALRVTFTLSAEAWALLERALQGARHRAATPLSDAEALEAVARDALAAQNHPTDAAAATLARGSRNLHLESEVRCVERGAANASAGADTAALRAGVNDTNTDEPTPGETATHLGFSNAPAARLLRIIGRRANWTLDELGRQSGLRVAELQHALLLLELEGRVRRPGGLVEPTRVGVSEPPERTPFYARAP